jgi:Flp pilus assembly protein TadG
LIAVLLVGLLAFVAMAIDLGLMMIARTQAQDTADAAAMAGARTLNGDTANNNNYANAGPNATTAATAHTILNQPVTSSQVTTTIGDYYYDSTAGAFKINATGRQTGDNWTLVQTTVKASGSFFFGQYFFGISGFNVSATATAAHRPRDIVIIQDFSGSMRFDSLIGTPHNATRNASMNPETVYPKFGHYGSYATNLTYQADVQASTGEIQGACNDVIATNDGNPVVTGFYADTSAFGTSTPAFTAASTSYQTTPGGDAPQFTSQNSTSTYAKTVQDITGGTTRDGPWELDGYSAYPTSGLTGKTDYSTVPFNGYTQGPNYWGKTFFLWPPDPRQPPSYYRNVTVVKQFIADITGMSVASQGTQSPVKWVQGIYQLTSGVTGSQNWTSWANATTLQAYLTNASFRPILTTDQVNRILRLFNLAGAGALNKAACPGLPTDGSGNGLYCDWRSRFFFKNDGTTPLNVNDSSGTGLWSGGTFVAPNGSTGPYLVNYNAILYWIKHCGPNPFPSQLRAGGVIYYTAIPDTIDTSTFPPADPNQRFWKEYIDEVLGLQQTSGTGTSASYSQIVGNTGYGPDVSWGTVSTSGVPASTYMSYTDNPQRPLLHFWFGPMSLLDYLGNYNMGRYWWPGTVTEAPTYQTKLGMQGALEDIFKNHPNDNVAQIFFSSPKSSATSVGYYNYARTPLSRDLYRMINCLWFSPKIITNNAEINIYDSTGTFTGDITDVPRANGGTCYAMPLMLAYNQFSTNSGLQGYTANAPTGTAGGMGRNGSAKMLVFETDGMVNTGCQASLTGSGTTAYYQLRVADANNYAATGTEFPTSVAGVTFSTGATQSTTIATQLVTDFSTTRKPVLIHCIAFGSLFNSGNSSTYKTNALQNLANLEVIGNVQTGSPTTLASNKIITGNFNTRISLLQSAFSTIMQDGVQVTLLASGPGQP